MSTPPLSSSSSPSTYFSHPAQDRLVTVHHQQAALRRQLSRAHIRSTSSTSTTSSSEPPMPSSNGTVHHSASVAVNGHDSSSTEPPPRPRSMSVRTASLRLKFAVIGGGIGGLACAYALVRAGHTVRVLERSGPETQRGGGLRVPPNLHKTLVEWGLGDELAQKSQRCRGSTFWDLESGEKRGYLEWKDEIIRETGGDFLLVHHADLHSMLTRLALSVGVQISYNSTVDSLSMDNDDQKEQGVSIKLTDGETVTADVAVGADGFRSLVRQSVTGIPRDEGSDTGMSVLTTTVDPKLMRQDPELAKLPDISEWPMWMGDGRSVLAYPVRQGAEYCLHIFWPNTLIDSSSDTDNRVEEEWDIVVPTSRIQLENSCDLIKRLISLAPEAIRTKFVQREIVDDWVDDSGRVVLIGEAAHALMPCGIYGSSLAVEDAAVLGVLLSRLRSRDQLPMLLEAYQDLRQPRCTAVGSSEFNNAALVFLPPGEARDLRDAGMKAALESKEARDSLTGEDEEAEGVLREQYQAISEVFGYSAREAAEDWWVQWGSLSESSKGANMTVFDPLDLKFEVAEVVTTSPFPMWGAQETSVRVD